MNKQDLQSIKENNYALPEDCDLQRLTTELEELLASTDLHLREGSFLTFAHWMEAGHFTDDEMIVLGNRLRAKLRVGLGTANTDTSFLRSYAALVLAVILEVNHQFEAGNLEGREAFLDEERTVEWLGDVLDCFSQEKDRRGFVPEKGWTHTIAHEADLLAAFAQSSKLQGEHLLRILAAISANLREPTDTTHRFDEDERLAKVVIDVLYRNALDMSSLRSWIKPMTRRLDGAEWKESLKLAACDFGNNCARVNTRDFLRSLYFQISSGPRRSSEAYMAPRYERGIDVREELLAELHCALRAIDLYFYADEQGS